MKSFKAVHWKVVASTARTAVNFNSSSAIAISAAGTCCIRLSCRAPSLALSLERLREAGSFTNAVASFSEFDWRLDVPKAAWQSSCAPTAEIQKQV